MRIRVRCSVSITNLTAPPASGPDWYFLGSEAKPAELRSVPNSCQRIAELAVLADLVRRRNSKLRAVNSGRGTDSVPGHSKFSNTYHDFCFG